GGQRGQQPPRVQHHLVGQRELQCEGSDDDGRRGPPRLAFGRPPPGRHSFVSHLNTVGRGASYCAVSGDGSFLATSVRLRAPNLRSTFATCCSTVRGDRNRPSAI